MQRGRFRLSGTRAPCGSNSGNSHLISSSKSSWGGARPNSGGPRLNAGGPRANSGGYRPGSGAKRRVVVVAEAADALRWYCVRTGHGCERSAALDLGIAGFETFLPSEYIPARRARRAGCAVLPATPARVVALFSRYLFVRAVCSAGNLRAIRATPGFEGILGYAPGSPVAVPDAAIAFIRGFCGANGCHYPANVNLRDLGAPQRLGAGDAVRLVAGPMAELVGSCQWSDAHRVRVLLDILGRQVPVTVFRTAVEAA